MRNPRIRVAQESCNDYRRDCFGGITDSSAVGAGSRIYHSRRATLASHERADDLFRELQGIRFHGRRQ